MEITLEEFQEAAKARRKKAGGGPRRYRPEHREFAVAFAQKALEDGASKASILETLGISVATLAKWLGSDTDKHTGMFRRVQLRSESGKGCGLTLVTPGGFRVEGLTLESAAALISTLE